MGFVIFMANFNYQSFSEGLLNRFSELPGSHLWRDLVTSPTPENLTRLRLFGLGEGVNQIKKKLPNPRVFISHRQADKDYALRVAHLANQNGFDYWVDVLDPNLSAIGAHPDPDDIAILTAAIIEMALINCTHVLVIMTPNTKGSLWVPYEYGRITELPTVHGRAAAWLHPGLNSPPEYLLLGVIAKTEFDIETWFESELTVWQNPLAGPQLSGLFTLPLPI